MEEEALREGLILDGRMAQEIANFAPGLREVAVQALKKIGYAKPD